MNNEVRALSKTIEFLMCEINKIRKDKDPETELQLVKFEDPNYKKIGVN